MCAGSRVHGIRALIGIAWSGVMSMLEGTDRVLPEKRLGYWGYVEWSAAHTMRMHTTYNFTYFYNNTISFILSLAKMHSSHRVIPLHLTLSKSPAPASGHAISSSSMSTSLPVLSPLPHLHHPTQNSSFAATFTSHANHLCTQAQPRDSFSLPQLCTLTLHSTPFPLLGLPTSFRLIHGQHAHLLQCL